MEQINEQTVLSADEVRQRYGINIEAVKALARVHALPCIRAGTRYVFPLSSLVAFEIELGKQAAQNYSKQHERPLGQNTAQWGA